MQKDHPQGPEEEADHLLSLLKKGDKSGLEQLFRMFYKPLVIYAHRLLGNQADAEDAGQEIFIKFWQRDQFADIRSYLRSYLYNSVRNHCVNILESRKGKTSVPLESIPDIPDESTIAEKQELEKRLEEIHREIEKLPTRTRHIVQAILLEHKKYKEVAETEHIAVNTVKTLLQRALTELRGKLNRDAFLLLLFYPKE